MDSQVFLLMYPESLFTFSVIPRKNSPLLSVMRQQDFHCVKKKEKVLVLTEAREEGLAAPLLNISYSFLSWFYSVCRDSHPFHLNRGLSTIHLESRPMDVTGRAKKVITQRASLTPWGQIQQFFVHIKAITFPSGWVGVAGVGVVARLSLAFSPSRDIVYWGDDGPSWEDWH